MSFGNLLRDIEPKPEITFGVVVVLIFRAALKRFKDVDEFRFLDARTLIDHLETNFPLVSGYSYTHRRVWGSVLDRIPHQVAE